VGTALRAFAHPTTQRFGEQHEARSMSFFSRLGQSVRAATATWRNTRATDTTADALLWGDQLWSVASAAGVEINQQTALGASAVMACVMMLTEDVAKLPVSLYRPRADKSREPVTDHFLADLFEQPNPWQDWLEFAEMVQVGLVLRGNGYAVIVRDWRGRPVKLVPVNPDRVALWEAPTGELFYRVTPFGLHEMAELRDMPFLIPFEDMFHLRGLSVNGLVGMSRIAVARDVIGLAIAQERQAASFVGQGSRPSGVLTTDQKLDKVTVERVKERWKEINAGLANSGKAAILEAGLSWKALSLSAQELEFIAARQFQLQEIARMFRIPPHMIGELSRSTNNNIVQQSQEYVNFTISGYTRRWRAKLRMTFGLARDDIHVEHDLSELVRADIVARYNGYRTGIMSGFLKPNEARIDDGRDPDPKGGELMQPTNMSEMGSQSSGTGAGDGRPPDGTVSPKNSNAAPIMNVIFASASSNEPLIVSPPGHLSDIWRRAA
jgi:HK97 family phage portal protein